MFKKKYGKNTFSKFYYWKKNTKNDSCTIDKAKNT